MAHASQNEKRVTSSQGSIKQFFSSEESLDNRRNFMSRGKQKCSPQRLLRITNGEIHAASTDEEDFLFLKLDVVKAFDKMEELYTSTPVREFGFGPFFKGF